MRKIIQICESTIPETGHSLYEARLSALCNDGSVWYCSSDEGGNWKRYPDIPQDDFEENLCNPLT